MAIDILAHNPNPKPSCQSQSQGQPPVWQQIQSSLPSAIETPTFTPGPLLASAMDLAADVAEVRH